MKAQYFYSPCYPEWEGISSFTRQLANEASEALSGLDGFHRRLPSTPVRLKLANPRLDLRSGVLKKLERPLSDIMVQKCGPPILVSSRSGVEEEIFRRNYSELSKIARLSGKEFIALIEHVASSLHEEETRIRKGFNVMTKPDSQGEHWKFVDWRLVKRELFSLQDFIVQHDPVNNTVFRASVFLGAFNCIHPLRDGNGRTSRIMFNALLHSGLDQPKFYIPLKEFMGLSRYGFELAMRESLIFGRWATLVAFCSNILLVMAEVSQKKSDFDWKLDLPANFDVQAQKLALFHA